MPVIPPDKVRSLLLSILLLVFHLKNSWLASLGSGRGSCPPVALVYTASLLKSLQ
jgi:hypothetical protein